MSHAHSPVGFTRAVRASALGTLMLALGTSGFGQGPALKDIAGSRDPAGIKRYEGSTIIGYKFEKFGEFTFMLGPVKPATEPTGPRRIPAKSQRAEGQYTRLVYTAPEGRSTLEVLRNYEQELAKAGFAPAYRCTAAECGDAELADRYLYTMDNRLSNYPPPGSGRAPGQVTAHAFSSAKDQRLLVAKRTGAGGDSWVSVLVGLGTFDMHKETLNHPVVLVDLVEAAPMETRMVTVDAAAMAKDINATGHVALYGILFDTDKTDIKPESAETIAEVAKFLKQDPAVKLYVVGHTDNVGGHDYNMNLSQRRAAAVVQELTAKHAVPAARLKPAGAGPIAPVAPNDNDAGRAKNRRVELVKQ